MLLCSERGGRAPTASPGRSFGTCEGALRRTALFVATRRIGSERGRACTGQGSVKGENHFELRAAPLLSVRRGAEGMEAVVLRTQAGRNG